MHSCIGDNLNWILNVVYVETLINFTIPFRGCRRVETLVFEFNCILYRGDLMSWLGLFVKTSSLVALACCHSFQFLFHVTGCP